MPFWKGPSPRCQVLQPTLYKEDSWFQPREGAGQSHSTAVPKQPNVQFMTSGLHSLLGREPFDWTTLVILQDPTSASEDAFHKLNTAALLEKSEGRDFFLLVSSCAILVFLLWLLSGCLLNAL